MLASENTMNMSRWLMSDNVLGDGGKPHVSYLKMFWEQSVKMASQYLIAWPHNTTTDWPTANKKDLAIGEMYLCCFICG